MVTTNELYNPKDRIQLDKEVLVFLKRIYRKLFTPPALNGISYYDDCDYKGQPASDKIKELLAGDKPVMIARFGWGELTCLTHYLSMTDKGSSFSKAVEFIRNKRVAYWREPFIRKAMFINAGLFPYMDSISDKYCEMILEDANQIDLLGSWMKEELLIEPLLKNCIKVPLEHLEPYYHAEPWSKVLENKKVLVIHPFEKSIREQYQKREQLFKNKNILPSFELSTIKAVQSMAGNYTGFKDWFESYQYMSNAISNSDFDIAIIGCGAYGMPLAAHVKRMGKKAVHLGGATQLMFGIKGKRWDTTSYKFINDLYNEYWSYPFESEKPENFNKVEAGCYW